MGDGGPNLEGWLRSAVGRVEVGCGWRSQTALATANQLMMDIWWVVTVAGRGRGLVRNGGVEEVRWMRKDERSTENNKKIIRSLLTGID